MEVEEVDADGNAEVLPAFEFEGPIREVCQWEVGSGLICFGEPALMSRGGSFCHGGMIAPNNKGAEVCPLFFGVIEVECKSRSLRQGAAQRAGLRPDQWVGCGGRSVLPAGTFSLRENLLSMVFRIT